MQRTLLFESREIKHSSLSIGSRLFDDRIAINGFNDLPILSPCVLLPKS